jgi:hypothetical protein
MRKIFITLVILFIQNLSYADISQIEGEWVRLTSTCSHVTFADLLPIDRSEKFKNLHYGMTVEFYGNRYFQTNNNPTSCKSGVAGCVNTGSLTIRSNTIELSTLDDPTWTGWGVIYTNFTVELDEQYLILKATGLPSKVCSDTNMSILFERKAALLMM